MGYYTKPEDTEPRFVADFAKPGQFVWPVGRTFAVAIYPGIVENLRLGTITKICGGQLSKNGKTYQMMQEILEVPE